MPRLTQCFSIKEILLIKIDLRQVLGADLHFDPTSGAGGVPTTVVIQHKSENLRCLQQRRVDLNLSALALRIEKRYARHRKSPLNAPWCQPPPADRDSAAAGYVPQTHDGTISCCSEPTRQPRSPTCNSPFPSQIHRAEGDSQYLSPSPLPARSWSSARRD